MNLRIGFSPCPNDTFIFHAMIHGLVHGPKVHWEPHLEDVEQLNQRALRGEYDVTKLSFHAYARCHQHYQLLTSGAALGFGCGPLLISREPMTLEEINRARIAIPGELTTAHFLFRLAYPQATNRTTMIFSEIENAVLRGEADAGVIIHENRFTYQEKGLTLIQDLGQYWETRTGSPIPLGGIAIRRGLDDHLKVMIQEQIANSVRYAWAHPQASADYIQCHAQEMDPRVTRQHIELYVNDYSADLGTLGRQAITKLYAEAVQSGILEEMPVDLFL